jgi:uncharacterized protein YndB with AHSA1/START domain
LHSAGEVLGSVSRFCSTRVTLLLDTEIKRWAPTTGLGIRTGYEPVYRWVGPGPDREDGHMDPSSHNETTFVADDAVPAIRITRDFHAPPSLVFGAHTDPELFARWVGPRDLVTAIDTWDCRTGGNWAFHQAQGEEVYSFFGSFHEIRPDTVIVQTFTFTGFPDAVSLDRLEFEDLGNGRTRLRTISLVDSFETRDAMIAGDVETGVREGYAALDDILADSGTPTSNR